MDKSKWQAHAIELNPIEVNGFALSPLDVDLKSILNSLGRVSIVAERLPEVIDAVCDPPSYEDTFMPIQENVRV